MEEFVIERMNDDAIIPTKAYETDAGFDLYLSEDLVIWPLEGELGKTGIKISLKSGYEAQIRPRSGFSIKNKILIINSPGTIDPEYRGEIMIALYNLSNVRRIFKKGTKIAQMIINKIPNVKLIEGKVDSNTDRGLKGFGSTGDNI